MLDDFKTWLDEQNGDTKVLSKSAIGTAVRYAINQWQPLLSYTTEGDLPIDNNDTERDLRRLTIERKNWLFFGSSAEGEVAKRTGAKCRHARASFADPSTPVVNNAG